MSKKIRLIYQIFPPGTNKFVDCFYRFTLLSSKKKAIKLGIGSIVRCCENFREEKRKRWSNYVGRKTGQRKWTNYSRVQSKKGYKIFILTNKGFRKSWG